MLGTRWGFRPMLLQLARSPHLELLMSFSSQASLVPATWSGFPPRTVSVKVCGCQAPTGAPRQWGGRGKQRPRGGDSAFSWPVVGKA